MIRGSRRPRANDLRTNKPGQADALVVLPLAHRLAVREFRMKNVSFITTEEGDDLIVSFAIPGTDPSDVKSLTLLRTPKYEFILDDAERGVNVFFDDYPDDEVELLEAVEIERHVIQLVTSRRQYTLNVQDVDHEDMKQAKRVLKKMNFDERFGLRIVEP